MCLKLTIIYNVITMSNGVGMCSGSSNTLLTHTDVYISYIKENEGPRKDSK